MTRRSGIALACALLVASVATSSAYASASFGIERYTLTATEKDSSADTQAGSHPYELTAETVLEPNGHTSADEVRNLDLALPPGLTINPASVAQNNAIGMVQIDAAGKIASATVYNLAPAPGEFARFGFTLEGDLVIAGVSVRPDSGDGMTLSIRDLPHWEIESVKLMLGGLSSSTLLTLPTSCAGPLQTTLQGESWGGETTSLLASLPQMTGCNRLRFQPALSVVPAIAEAGEPSGYQVQLSVPQNESPEGLATAHIQDASVTLPAGASLSLSAADGLTGCEAAQVALDSSEPAICPNSSKVGLVKIGTPLLAHPMQGAVFFATPNANPFGALVALYLVAEEPTSGVRIKLAGQVALNPSTGQPTLTFDDLPQLPIDEIELELFGGPRALLSTPSACGVATSTSELTPWSGNEPVLPSSSFEINSGANGTLCSDPRPFSPTFQTDATNGEASSYNSLTFVVSRADQEEQLSTIAIQAPQAVQEMFSGVPLCGEPQAVAGSCADASGIGRVQLAAGSGPDPYYLTGNVYLTGPPPGGIQSPGAQQGLSIVVPFNAGPFELGTMVIRASEQIAPSTGQMSILSDPLPSIVDGIPIPVRELALRLDRGEFTLNSDGCEPGTVTGTITSAQGSSVAIPTEPLGASSQCNPPQTAVSVPTTSGVSPSIGRVSLAGSMITVQSGREAAVRLTCTGTATCVGNLTLTAKTKGKGKKKAKTTTIGTATFSIPPGKTTTIKIKVNAAGRSLLGADHGRLSATLTFLKTSPTPSQTPTESVHLVQQKAHGKTKK